MKRILSLDGLRFFMCITVFLSHCTFLTTYSYGQIYSSFFCNAQLALDYFFMLSGFGLFFNGHIKHKRSLTDKVDLFCSVRFVINKIKKIYPVYIFSLLLFLPIYIRKKYLKTYIVQFLINLTLLQSLTLSTSFSHAINGVCWFLSTLTVCYICCPFLFEIVKNVKKWGGYGCIVSTHFLIVLIAEKIFYDFIYNKGVSYAILGWRFPLDDISIIECSLLISLGMIVASIYFETKPSRIEKIQKSECIIIIVVFAYYLLHNSVRELIDQRLAVRIIDIVVCFVFMYIMALSKGKISAFLSGEKMVSLGKYSLYIYLLHYPVIQYISSIFEYFAIDVGDITGLVELLLCIITTGFLVVLYVTCEKFAKEKIKKRSLSNPF